MESQQVFNILVGIVGGLVTIIGTCVTWWVNNMWAEHKTLKAELSDFKLKVANESVSKVDLEKISDKIFHRLDEISKEVNHISRNQAQAKAMAEAINALKPDHKP